MDFDTTDEQQQLADSLRKYLATSYDFEERKKILASATGTSDTAWRTFADMGLLALTLPEADGGFGGGAADLMAPFEAFGEALVVEPLLDNVALAGRLIARAGSAAQRAAVLGGLADGSRRLAFASLEPGRRYDARPQDTTASRGATGWTLQGHKRVVVGAPQADMLVVSARTPGGARLFLVDPRTAGVTLKAFRTADGQRAADLQFNAVALPADALLGADADAQPAIDEALDFATALLCCDLVGAMQSANAATLDYLKTRKQFGTAIGAFQALQHRMVDMFIACEFARSMAILAVCRVDAAAAAASPSDPAVVAERQRAVSQAMVRVADAARQISQESVQLHGGMGMTEELKVSHTFRRLTLQAQRFGDADHHLARLASPGP